MVGGSSWASLLKYANTTRSWNMQDSQDRNILDRSRQIIFHISLTLGGPSLRMTRTVGAIHFTCSKIADNEHCKCLPLFQYPSPWPAIGHRPIIVVRGVLQNLQERIQLYRAVPKPAVICGFGPAWIFCRLKPGICHILKEDSCSPQVLNGSPAQICATFRTAFH
jgi:hypothetical protein